MSSSSIARGIQRLTYDIINHTKYLDLSVFLIHSLSFQDQAVARCHRFGQTKECFVYRLVSYGTIEEAVYKRQVLKTTTSKRVIDNQKMKSSYVADEVLLKVDLRSTETPSETIEIPAEDQLLSHVIEKHQNLFRDIVLHDSLLESQGMNDKPDLNDYSSEDYATASTSSSSKSTAYRNHRTQATI